MAMKAQRVVDGKIVNSHALRQLKRKAKKEGKELKIFADLKSYREAKEAKKE